MQIEAAGSSDRGLQRPRNEDRILICRVDGDNEAAAGTLLLAVADGVGGYAGGEVASQLAIETLREAIQRQPSSSPRRHLARLFQAANRAVFDLAASHPEYTGMATTLVAALVRRNRVSIANVGDSRAYLIRDGAAQQVTADHSWLAEREKAGLPSERAPEIGRNILTRSLGTAGRVQVDTFGRRLQAGDMLVLASDGLYATVADGEIAAVASDWSPEEAAARLVAVANERGGPDNISIVIARCTTP